MVMTQIGLVAVVLGVVTGRDREKEERNRRDVLTSLAVERVSE